MKGQMMSREIQIRRYESTDVDAIYEAVIESRSELSPWMPWCHAGYSQQETISWVESRAGAWVRNEEWSFLIVDPAGRVLGGCGIHLLDLRNGVGELGYWVRTSATRSGVATQAAQRIMEWAFREQGLHRIEILAAVENVASQRVAEKVGAIREGVLRGRLVLNDRRQDAALSAVIANGR